MFEPWSLLIDCYFVFLQVIFAFNVFFKVMLATSKFALLPPTSLPSSLLPDPQQWRWLSLSSSYIPPWLFIIIIIIIIIIRCYPATQFCYITIVTTTFIVDPVVVDCVVIIIIVIVEFFIDRRTCLPLRYLLWPFSNSSFASHPILEPDILAKIFSSTPA